MQKPLAIQKCDGWIDGPTDIPTDSSRCKVTCPRIKWSISCSSSGGDAFPLDQIWRRRESVLANQRSSRGPKRLQIQTRARTRHRSLVHRGQSAKRESWTSLVWISERNCSFQNRIFISQRVCSSPIKFNLIYISTYLVSYIVLDLKQIQSHLDIADSDYFLELLW